MSLPGLIKRLIRVAEKVIKTYLRASIASLVHKLVDTNPGLWSSLRRLLKISTLNGLDALIA